MGEQTEVPKGNRPDGFQAGREPSEGVVARGVGRDGAEPAASSLQPARAEGGGGSAVSQGVGRFRGAGGGALFYVFKGVHCSRSQVVEEQE